jgi:hypothetical protein
MLKWLGTEHGATYSEGVCQQAVYTSGAVGLHWDQAGAVGGDAVPGQTPLCPKYGYVIQPEERRRVDFEHVECPKCHERFIPGQSVVCL